MFKLEKKISLWHIISMLILFVGFVSFMRSEVARTDAVETRQKLFAVQIERVEDSITSMNTKLDRILADVNYLRGLNKVRPQTNKLNKQLSRQQNNMFNRTAHHKLLRYRQP